jgi:hypothetical protein
MGRREGEGYGEEEPGGSEMRRPVVRERMTNESRQCINVWRGALNIDS